MSQSPTYGIGTTPPSPTRTTTSHPHSSIAAAYGHDAIIDILLLHDEVVDGWALQGWKEETLDEALKENNPGERNVHSEIGWDLNTGRMPQAPPCVPRTNKHSCALAVSLDKTPIRCAPSYFGSGEARSDVYSRQSPARKAAGFVETEKL